MKKRIIFLITVILFILTSVITGVISQGCATSEPAQFITYTDKDCGFSMNYPENWHTETPENPPELKLSIWEKEFGINPAGFMVGKYSAAGYNLEDFFDYRKDYMRKNIEDYSLILREDVTVNGVPAIKYTYSRTLGSTAYKSAEMCLFKNSTGWIVSFSCPEKTFDTYRNIIDTCFKSFSLID